MQAYIWIALIMVLAFLFFVVCINFDKIKSALKNKKPKAKKQKEQKSQVWEDEAPQKNEKPKFVPKNQVTTIPDSTYDFEDTQPPQPTPQLDDIPEDSEQNEQEDFLKNFKITKQKSTKKSISKTIKNLPPQIKAMLIDNTLKRKDDV